jgi:hypothetical protein
MAFRARFLAFATTLRTHGWIRASHNTPTQYVIFEQSAIRGPVRATLARVHHASTHISEIAKNALNNSPIVHSASCLRLNHNAIAQLATVMNTHTHLVSFISCGLHYRWVVRGTHVCRLLSPVEYSSLSPCRTPSFITTQRVDWRNAKFVSCVDGYVRRKDNLCNIVAI